MEILKWTENLKIWGRPAIVSCTLDRPYWNRRVTHIEPAEQLSKRSADPISPNFPKGAGHRHIPTTRLSSRVGAHHRQHHQVGGSSRTCAGLHMLRWGDILHGRGLQTLACQWEASFSGRLRSDGWPAGEPSSPMRPCYSTGEIAGKKGGGGVTAVSRHAGQESWRIEAAHSVRGGLRRFPRLRPLRRAGLLERGCRGALSRGGHRKARLARARTGRHPVLARSPGGLQIGGARQNLEPKPTRVIGT